MFQFVQNPFGGTVLPPRPLVWDPGWRYLKISGLICNRSWAPLQGPSLYTPNFAPQLLVQVCDVPRGEERAHQREKVRASKEGQGDSVFRVCSTLAIYSQVTAPEFLPPSPTQEDLITRLEDLSPTLTTRTTNVGFERRGAIFYTPGCQ